MLKVSDGKWTTRRLIRVETGGALGVGNIPDLVGQPISGISSQATAIVTSTVSFREGGTTIVEIEIDEKHIIYAALLVTLFFFFGVMILPAATISDDIRQVIQLTH